LSFVGACAGGLAGVPSCASAELPENAATSTVAAAIPNTFDPNAFFMEHPFMIFPSATARAAAHRNSPVH
jgi:hypothetical protein